MKAAILEKIGAPLTVAEIALPLELARGQVLVKVLCTGICGSQLQEIDGKKGDPNHLPHLLGHEGCGIVVDTGSGVETLKNGDKVVMHWRKGAGIEAEPAIYWTETGAIKAGPITTFSEYAVVSENRVTAIPADIPNDFAALLGCALSTAISIIEKEVNGTFGKSIVVNGCGGVGLCLLLALQSHKAQVTGVDVSDAKKDLVAALGATFSFADYASGRSPSIILDTVRNEPPSWFTGQYISLQPGGTSGGGFQPEYDIPRYVESGIYEEDYWKVITHRLPLERINDGIQLMRDGKAGRVMIEM